MLLAPVVVSFALYWKAVTVDGGWLDTADDRALLDGVRSASPFASLSELHGLHFIPAMRFVYLVMYALFGTEWTPYGVALVLSHGLLGTSIAALVYRFGRSWLAALAVVLPLITSWALSSGVLTSFVYVTIYPIVCLIVLAPILVERYVRQPSWPVTATLFVMLAWSIFTLLSSLLLFITVGLFYVGFRYVYDVLGVGVDLRALVGRRDGVLLGVAGLALGLYALAYSSALASIGWRLPVEMDMCQETYAYPQLDRFLYVLTFGYFGFVSQGGFGYLPADELGNWHYVGGGVTLLAIGLAGLVVFRRSAAREQRVAALVIGGFLVLALIGSAMVMSGRSCVQLWHMRYSVYTLACVACAVGVLLGRLLTGAPKRVAPVLGLVVLVVAALLTYDNVQFVLSSPWLVKRAPGFLLGS